MATIRQTKTGRWQAQVYLGKNAQTGKPEFRTKTKDTKAQAAAWARQAEVDRDDGDVATKAQADAADGRLTVGEFWRDTVLPSRRVNLERATVARNTSHWVNHLEPTFGHRPLVAVRRAEVKAWVVALQDGRNADGTERPKVGVPTVQSALHLLSGIYTHAMDDELTDDNPCTGIRTRKHEPADKGYLSRDDVAAVLSHTPEPYRLFLELMTFTGLRFSEAAGITPEFVLRDASQVKVRKVWARGVLKDIPKNSTSRRVVPVPQALRARLAAVALKAEPGTLVFRGAHGGGLSDSNIRQRILGNACEHAGVRPVTPHMLRHAYTSWLTEAGVNAKDIAGALGHSSTRMQDRYSHLAPGHGERILEALEVPPEPKAARFGGTPLSDAG